MSKKDFYVVLFADGKIGHYTKWSVCKKAIKGKSWNHYKGFPTLYQAIVWAEMSGKKKIDPKAHLPLLEERAATILRTEPGLLDRLEKEGCQWGEIQRILHSRLKLNWVERGFEDVAYKLVPKALSSLYGAQGKGWHTVRVGGKAIVKAGPAQARLSDLQLDIFAP